MKLLRPETPAETSDETVGEALGMSVTVYDGKLVLFAEGDAPLSTYADLYTFEAMYLAMPVPTKKSARMLLSISLLAGYPPETISTHQMPEAEAIPGTLGVPLDRLTPVDIALSCGTAYGGTRYGTVYHGFL